MPQEFLPLLKPENIDELKSLILEIMEDNDSKLEKIIENRQDKALSNGEDFTIQDLNDLLSQQCLQKQKIISNLSHFSLSLMNTIDVLWQDNEDLEYRVKDQRDVINQMNNHLLETARQIEFLKNKLQVAYTDLQTVEQEKLVVEEYLSSIIVKHDSSFCLKQRNRLERKSSREEKMCYENGQNDRLEIYFTEGEVVLDRSNEQKVIQPVQLTQRREQNSSNDFQKQDVGYLANRKSTEVDLLEQSVIKDSISVLRRFTLADSVEESLPILEESHEDIKFITKSNRFSLINEISLQIFGETKQKNLPSTAQSFQWIPEIEKSVVRDLKISNEKVNITIPTGTEFSETRDSSSNRQEQFSKIQPTPSCSSFMLYRQNSAVMYPSLERSSSTISFVTHTTKQIQTDPHPPKFNNLKQKHSKSVEKKIIDIQTSTFENRKQLEKVSALSQQKKKLSQNQSQKIEESTSRKSFGKLLDYFTKKIVSDRIKTGYKKNNFEAFKKPKSNIQKVF